MESHHRKGRKKVENTSSGSPLPASLPRSLGKLIIGGIAFLSLGTFGSELIAWPRDVIQSAWNGLLDYTGDDDYTLWFWGTVFVSTAVYWLIGIFYTFADLTTVFSKYKLQPGVNEPVETKKLIKAIGYVIFNQLVVGVPFQYCIYRAVMWRGGPPVRELPSLLSIPFTIGVVALVEEVGFYYCHRMFHHRYFYRHIHKMHHEWTAPIAVTAIYCHPVEHLMCNLFPLLVGVTLTAPHLILVYLMLSYFTLSTMSHHSGYHLPFLPSPEFHDFHHLKFNQCYGLLEFLDRWHKTDTLFVSSGLSSRHKLLRSFTPMRDLVPLKNAVIAK